MGKESYSNLVHITYLLTALELTLSLSEFVLRSLLSWIAEALSSSDLGMEERITRLADCGVPSAFTTPTIPLTAPGLSNYAY